MTVMGDHPYFGKSDLQEAVTPVQIHFLSHVQSLHYQKYPRCGVCRKRKVSREALV